MNESFAYLNETSSETFPDIKNKIKKKFNLLNNLFWRKQKKKIESLKTLNEFIRQNAHEKTNAFLTSLKSTEKDDILNSYDATGFTPLHNATIATFTSDKRKTLLIEILLDHGADATIFIKDRKQTLLDITKEQLKTSPSNKIKRLAEILEAKTTTNNKKYEQPNIV